jgi:hypothetical protein
MKALAVKDSRKQCRDNCSQDNDAHVCRRCLKIEGAQKAHCEIDKAKIDDEKERRALSIGPPEKCTTKARKMKDAGE